MTVIFIRVKKKNVKLRNKMLIFFCWDIFWCAVSRAPRLVIMRGAGASLQWTSKESLSTVTCSAFNSRRLLWWKRTSRSRASPGVNWNPSLRRSLNRRYVRLRHVNSKWSFYFWCNEVLSFSDATVCCWEKNLSHQHTCDLMLPRKVSLCFCHWSVSILQRSLIQDCCLVKVAPRKSGFSKREFFWPRTFHFSVFIRKHMEAGLNVFEWLRYFTFLGGIWRGRRSNWPHHSSWHVSSDEETLSLYD